MLTQSLSVQAEILGGVSAHRDEVPEPAANDSAQKSFLRLSIVCYQVAEAITKIRAAQFPGLSNHFLERALIVVGGQLAGPLGTYQHEKWAFEDRSVDEIHINIGHDIYSGVAAESIAMNIVVTICHELAHFHASMNGIKDTSGRGNRYHNKQFAELAARFELLVGQSGRSHIGFHTPGLTAQGAADYADLICTIEEELRLFPSYTLPFCGGVDSPDSSGSGKEVAVQKYVFAQCDCRNKQGRKRTIRMARGWWLEGSIGCAICQHIFTESPPARTRAEASE